MVTREAVAASKTQSENTGLVEHIAAKGLKWRARLPKLCLPEIVGPDGEWPLSDSDSVQHLADHWGGAFAFDAIDNDSARVVLDCVPRVDVPVWFPYKDSMIDRINLSKDSSCGLDGVGKSAWRATRDWSHDLLWEGFEEFEAGVPLPCECRDGLLALLPKSAGALHDGRRGIQPDHSLSTRA